MPKKIEVEIGTRFGKWEVIGEGYSDGRRIWIPCRCECGREKALVKDTLTGGRSSGCRRCQSGGKVVHGGSGTPLFWVWCGMRKRCTDHKSEAYHNYGGRGITVCNQWKESFIAFRDWAEANGYAPGLDIDRRDNDRGYSPENCRWVTRQVNSVNRRKTVRITAFGETKNLKAWGDDPRSRVGYTGIAARLKSGMTPEQAIESPLAKRGPKEGTFSKSGLITAFGETKNAVAWGNDPRCKVTFRAIKTRLKRGMSPEEAITAPPYKRSG